MTTQPDQVSTGSKQIELLERLSNASGVSGAERDVRNIIIDSVKNFDVKVDEDALGNVIVHKPAESVNAMKVMLAAHIDEVGLMLKVDEGEGLFAFTTVGEMDIRQLPGKTVYVGKNKTPGVIGARAIHLTTAEERKQGIPVSTLRIDVGPKGKAEIGERAVFATEFWRNGNSIFGKALDDRLGVVTAIELLKFAPQNIDLYCVFNSQKEIGNRGEMVAAYNINPDFAILIDAAEAADFPIDQNNSVNSTYGSRLGDGPVIFPMHRKIISDPVLFEYFIKTAEMNNIPYQIGQATSIDSRAGAAGAINKVREGMRSINISVPVRHSHTAIGLAYKSDWENSIRLLKAGLDNISTL
jgi:tetrahedral aminopeptidase